MIENTRFLLYTVTFAGDSISLFLKSDTNFGISVKIIENHFGYNCIKM